ncbi:hypothetical protein KSD_76410 [Ktedonobacter sp. SOSP1-85]|nr:hypothetical protein KSD_76410 [Ktedonobacter sp. SOSP1-85]
MKRILDQLDLIEASVPEVSGRLDRSRIAAAGHSLGGYTTAMLLGARLTDPKDGTEVDMADSRIKAGVLLAAPGRGDADPSAFAAEHYSFFLHYSFAEMTTPALVTLGLLNLILGAGKLFKMRRAGVPDQEYRGCSRPPGYPQSPVSVWALYT